MSTANRQVRSGVAWVGGGVRKERSEAEVCGGVARGRWEREGERQGEGEREKQWVE